LNVREFAMGIETLNRAADAAGYAMAAPDDEVFSGEDRTVIAAEKTSSLKSEDVKSTSFDAVAMATTWIREHLPLTGGRAPA
jgi:hypothetical protein